MVLFLQTVKDIVPTMVSAYPMRTSLSFNIEFSGQVCIHFINIKYLPASICANPLPVIYPCMLCEQVSICLHF